jgi:hypothetical protein
MKTKIAVILGTMALLLVVSSPAYAEDLDFTLVNDTGVTIAELFVSPVKVKDWQENILDVDMLEDGEEAEVSFSRDEDTCVWDLMIKDTEGTSVTWKNIDLCEYAIITLHIEDGKVWATFE